MGITPWRLSHAAPGSMALSLAFLCLIVDWKEMRAERAGVAALALEAGLLAIRIDYQV